MSGKCWGALRYISHIQTFCVAPLLEIQSTLRTQSEHIQRTHREHSESIHLTCRAYLRPQDAIFENGPRGEDVESRKEKCEIFGEAEDALPPADWRDPPAKSRQIINEDDGDNDATKTTLSC